MLDNNSALKVSLQLFTTNIDSKKYVEIIIEL